MCGIAGLVANTRVNQDLYDALTVLQHRGQDAAGIVTCDQGRFFMRKDNGLVRDVFHTRHMTRLAGTMGIAHVRYPTAGSGSIAEAQPFYVNSPYGIAFAHNGNLTNSADLHADVFRSDLRHINTNSDSEILLNVFAHELQQQGGLELQADDIFAAVQRVYSRARGAYAAVAMIINYGIVAFRDPNGIRPLVYGRRETPKGTEYMIASESVALDVLGFELVRDVLPGEAIYISTRGEVHTRVCAANTRTTPCIFEYVYFARPDSIIDKVSVHKARLRMGDKLATRIIQEWPDHDIDVVIPIPDTSRTSAMQLATRLGVKYREGFIKNRYIGRTFIMPGQQLRKKSVRQKLNAIALEFMRKNVLLVDDSIVRGTTSEQIVQMAREAGARNVYLASAAPPVRYPNVYGIDMPSPEEFVAHGRTDEEIREAIGADHLIYQRLDDLEDAVRRGNPAVDGFENCCFSGDYLTGDIDGNYLSTLCRTRSDSAKAVDGRTPDEVVEIHNAP